MMLAKLIGIILVLIGIATISATSPSVSVSNIENTGPIKTVITDTIATTTAKEKQTQSEEKTATTTSTEIKPKKTLPISPKPKVEINTDIKSEVRNTPTSTPLVSTPTPIIAPPPPNFSEINTMARKAIVNILCTSTTGGLFEPLSGSGVIIDPRGIILTNAHVAQYLLIQNYRQKNFLNCIARTGSPAVPSYTLKVFYISKKWMEKNYQQITSQKPTGTGENDFALLQITGSTNSDINLPISYPSISPDSTEMDIDSGNQVILAGYPAGFLGGIAIQRELYAVSSVVNIGKLYTFKEGVQELDAFGLGGSPVAQHGSSGGGAISGNGKLLGIIVTSTDAKMTSDRELDAISIPHINRILSEETGLTLNSLFATDLSVFSKNFDEQTLPTLTKLLTDELDSKNK